MIYICHEAIVLDKIDPNLFLARPENLWKPPYARAVFGGQVLGQALAAASQTVAPSLDSDYFRFNISMHKHWYISISYIMNANSKDRSLLWW